ncbi:hypothetical protein [Mycolicibacterium canariasense]|uniref:hypothetical protein n=1 Tax=Mycolicibacterium canariasense TaxID=228230 RepID=UPI0010426745|nr:hypothetical protein [Mycolicibacterium canariasense]MCV7211574.1 hypothetical protein [Mycolicibacterium canariasense]
MALLPVVEVARVAAVPRAVVLPRPEARVPVVPAVERPAVRAHRSGWLREPRVPVAHRSPRRLRMPRAVHRLPRRLPTPRAVRRRVLRSLMPRAFRRGRRSAVPRAPVTRQRGPSMVRFCRRPRLRVLIRSVRRSPTPAQWCPRPVRPVRPSPKRWCLPLWEATLSPRRRPSSVVRAPVLVAPHPWPQSGVVKVPVAAVARPVVAAEVLVPEVVPLEPVAAVRPAGKPVAAVPVVVPRCLRPPSSRAMPAVVAVQQEAVRPAEVVPVVGPREPLRFRPKLRWRPRP